MYKICHTTESSQRQRELEAVLLSALQSQPYKKISLTGLCRQAEVPRKTFYRYFPTKDDCLLALIDHTLSDCNSIALQGWTGDRELRKLDLLRFFSYWQNQRLFLNGIRDNNFQYLLLERTTAIVDKMKENLRSESFARDQAEYFIAHGLMASVLRWHHFGFPSTPEEMAEVIMQTLRCPNISITNLML